MKFTRRFTVEGQDPFSSVEYETRQSAIRKGDGTSASQTIQVEVPTTWSQIATDILAQKYLRRRDVPAEVGGLDGSETSVRQVVDRLAGCWRHWGETHGYFDSAADAQVFYDELVHMLLRQMGAPNSPQWFNTGLNWKYGIKGSSQGHFYVDPASGEIRKSEDAYTRPQPHACFIQSVEDRLLEDHGIYSLLEREGRIFKYGSGTGTNFSSIRAAGEPLSGGGASSGLMSFLRMYDRAAGAIKSGGTTRRAAKMVCLDLDHPEVEEFILWKSREEAKVGALVGGSQRIKSLMGRILALGDPRKQGERERAELLRALKQGMDWGIPSGLLEKALLLAEQGVRDWHVDELDFSIDGAAYETVSGQNSNNSLRVPNAFLEKLRQDGEWELRARVDGSPMKTLKARKLWDMIVRAAWDCADPGVQFHDTINEWHTCPADGPIRASNPCSEYMFLDDTACNLASLNLVQFQAEDGTLRIDDFRHAVRLWTVVLEISVAMAQFPSEAVAQKSFDFRTLGLGYANLGAFLMRSGIAYDSDASAAITGAITALMGGESYRASAEMARDLGAFPRYDANRDPMLRVIRNHRRAAYAAAAGEYEGLTVVPKGIDPAHCPESLLAAARKSWDEALALGEKNGYRNAQVTVLAPTGTIGLLMDCDTTGIEPDFALVKYKKLVGGGYFKVVNGSVASALRHLGYGEDAIRAIEDYCKGRATLVGAPHINPESLRAKGLTDVELAAIEKALPSCVEISQAFHPGVVGRAALEKLGLAGAQLDQGGAGLLQALGFTQAQIQEADLYVSGTHTVEGAPGLKPEHVAVFDCANRCGQGTRSISYQGHLHIMGAAQPFLSGAISKTVNLPREASIIDVSDVYLAAHAQMIKAVALYRDGSKLSQPLNSSSLETELLTQAAAVRLDAPAPTATRVVEAPKSAEWRPRRRRLPTKRGGFVQELSIGGHKLFLRTGEYPDGQLGEIFIDMYKEGASYRGLLNCFAVLTSKALQYGVPLEELVDTFTFTRFEPAGPVDGHENIKNCTSILDLCFRALGLAYLGQTDFVHVKPAVEEIPATNGAAAKVPVAAAAPAAASPAATGSAKARNDGYTGESCRACGSIRVRRNGTCTLCDDCGSTSGCS